MQLINHDIHIWFVSLLASTEQEASLSILLSPDEIQRAERFKFPEHRRRFINARSVLRSILSLYTQVDAKNIRFGYNEHNKPVLDADLSQPLYFNLSHSDEVAVYAISRQLVGIDIEKIKPSYSLELAARFFTSEECHSLEQLPNEQQTAAFYRLWAKKEAIIKASGKSLATSLSNFTVSPSVTSEIIRWADKEWHVQSLAIASVFASALASEHIPQAIEYYDYKLW